MLQRRLHRHCETSHPVGIAPADGGIQAPDHAAFVRVDHAAFGGRAVGRAVREAATTPVRTETIRSGRDGDLRDPAVIARQLPDPATLPALSLVFVLGTSAPRQGLLGRWFGVGATLVPTATRCSALLARGYVGIGAFVDGLSSADLVYATSSEPSVTDLG